MPKNAGLYPRYIDVHANSKYYFPVDISNLDINNDLLREPNQWNDRSNRNTLYNPSGSGGVRGFSPHSGRGGFEHDGGNQVDMNSGFMGISGMNNFGVTNQQHRIN